MPVVERYGPAPNGVTIADIIVAYRRHADANGVHGAAAKSIRESVFKRFVAACGHIPVAHAKPFQLSDFIESQPGWKSSSTKRASANMIRAAFQWATDSERIDRNPFRAVKYVEAEPRQPMPEETIDEIILCANSKRFERAVRFLRWTGCRVSELCQLRWPNVDLEKGYCVIEKHKSLRYTRKAKIIVLVAECVTMLRELRDRTPDTLNGHVFVNNRGQPWNRTSLAHTLKRMKENGEIATDCTLHSIRHSFAHRTITNGAPLALISASLGHASPAFTARQYGHITDNIDAMRSAVEMGLAGK